jgi:hypothetical protein
MKALLTGAFALAMASVAGSLPAQWGPAIPGPAPAPRSFPLMAYDLNGARTLLFGGNWGNDFWSYAGGVWTQLQPPLLPSARSRAAMATDSFLGEIVLYGGMDSSSQFALDDTWHWNGTVWQQLAPLTSPGGLARHAMAYDAVRQVTVVFGGRNNLWIANQALGQTWEFAAGNWTNVAPVLSPLGRVDAAMAFHPATSAMLMFGGADSSGNASDETWSYDGTTWTQSNLIGPRPSARVGAVLVPVLSRNRCVLFGGRDPITTQIFNDTWEHDGVAWTQVVGVLGGVYPPRGEFGLTHDIGRDRLVLFGGAIANGSLRDDTWEYGAHWQAFGLACAGSGGLPSLVGGALPVLGAAATADLVNLPSASPFAFLAVGLSRTQWALGNLPALLTNFGMPNCRTYTSADLLVTLPASAGVANWTWSVPAQSVFLGTTFYLQGLSWDPGVNALGLTTSNALTLVVGG